MFRARWRAAVTAGTRLVGDLEIAEDAVQDTCAAALTQPRPSPSGPAPAAPERDFIGCRIRELARLSC